jgi:hypothetical protein
VFRPDSVGYATTIAFVKGRILQVHLDGLDARERKDQNHWAAEVSRVAVVVFRMTRLHL